MAAASEIRNGMVIKLGADLLKVINLEYHAGGGKMGGTVHMKLRNVFSGAIIERRFRPEEKIEAVSLDRQQMEYIYTDGEEFYFMDPDTYEQVGISKSVIGRLEKFLRPNMRIPVEFYEGRPVSILFPEVVELKVVTSPPGLHDQESSTMKLATLENGMEILVPQFIKEGETIRVEVETGKYVERVKQEGRKI